MADSDIFLKPKLSRSLLGNALRISFAFPRDFDNSERVVKAFGAMLAFGPALLNPYPLAQVFGSNPSNRWAGGSRFSLKEKRWGRDLGIGNWGQGTGTGNGGQGTRGGESCTSESQMILDFSDYRRVWPV